MGRRLLVILGILVVVSARAPLARGQDEGQKGPPPAPVPVPAPVDSSAPGPIPEDLRLPPAPAAGESDDLGVGRPAAAPADEANKERAKPNRKASGGSTKKAEPDPEAESAFEGLMRKAESAQPRMDDHVMRAQVPAQAGAPPPPRPADAADSSGATVDRLPLGKQSVAVTVDVQAPASMNFNQEATLKLIVRNTGTSDALNVDIQDELPEGLKFISSQPEMKFTAQSHLSYRIDTLPAGSDRTISIRVKPTLTGPFDHAATVRFETGCRSRTRVLQPKLKVDVVANPTVGKVLKGQPVEFKVTVSNLGDGTARNVAIQAKLTTGLRHEAGGKSDDPILYELTLPELMPGRSEKLETLVADAVIGGEQGCTVSAKSPDVDFIKEEAEVTKTISVVEPKLKLTLEGPDSRYTDTIADYQVILENSGTAPARKIRVFATLPMSGKLVGTIPPEARFDATSRRLSWTIDQLEPNGKSLAFPFHVRMGGIGWIEVLAEANGDGGLKAKERKSTEVAGMPDVDLVVSEKKRALDVGGTTTFQIRLRNYGTKEATNLQVHATLSDNLEATTAGGGSTDVKVAMSPKRNEVTFEQISKLGPGKEMLFGIAVKVTGPAPRLATCRVTVLHDDQTEKFEDMAGVKVTTVSRAAAAPAAGGP
jgi:uncharacterized repeat protein (TIGR01451 family)